ncbi:MAG: hypothetical protein HN337_03135 [Deltaproteobacteria bacterium]|jgi:hypothetical protein|nr:hypothetical protein [Deltaproteobacteria bacterium]
MKTIKFIAVLIAVIISSSGCGGQDWTPVYFQPPDQDDETSKSPSESLGGRKCTVQFTSKLCVQIKGDNIEAGLQEGEELCGEVPPFPIHINGSIASIEGSEFPDIDFEGGGLPAPITLNARGDSDGSTNTGEGPADGSGNITVNDFSFYIVALGIVGEVPGLSLTTGSTDELPHLPSISGSPPDASGAMTMVIGTVLGSIIPAADKYLKGASLSATMTGSISPPLTECGGEAEINIEVNKLIIDQDGQQTESPIPEGKYMEISNGTFIAESDSDIGDRFESTEKFRATNVGSQAIRINVPPQKGPFYITSVNSLSTTLNPQQSIVMNVAFRPKLDNSEPGDISEPLSIGPDQFFMTASALSKAGDGSINLVDDDGAVDQPDVDKVEVGSSALPANTEKAFFLCKEIECNETKLITSCRECDDPSSQPCDLLPVSTDGGPIGEVDADCKIVNPDAVPLYTIDLKGNAGVSLDAQKQVLAIRNDGVSDLNIAKIEIEEIKGSKSIGQFSIPDGAIFIATSFKDVKDRVNKALDGKGDLQGTKLPLTLKPYQKGYQENSLYVVVTYQPNDLIGSDGQSAGIGSKVKDKATLKVTTDDGEIETIVTGTTTIQETPALELYFKTSVGARHVIDGGEFPLKGVTAETEDLAVPMFLRTADTSQNILRVISITIDGDDEKMFQWLDTEDKIAAVEPATGKGMRCSIPIIDESTGDMIDESFELKPVSLSPNGFDLPPGAYTTDSMPLFGCLNFHRDDAEAFNKRIFNANMTVVAQELDATGNPAKNPDGSYRQTTLTAILKAAINPRSGRLVMRITQTMSGILNPKFPGMSSITSKKDRQYLVDSGKIKETDFEVFLGAIILDPFDEMTIDTLDGEKHLTVPNDGLTAIFRALDTHPVDDDYENEWLFDYASLLHDANRPEGSRGIFEDYPNVPPDTSANGWRIFTGTLSYPGPLPPPGTKNPEMPSDCAVVNPCDPEGLKKFTKSGVGSDGKGACAFFYASGGRYDSPAFHTESEMPGGEYENLCNRINEPQTLHDLDIGYSSVDGAITFEEVGLRFFGPTYFHNPGGPLGNYPPMDEVFHMSFTTEVLKPQRSPEDYNVLPDENIDLSKSEFKINLDDPKLNTVPICKNTVKDKVFGGQRYSGWRYLEGLLFKDEEATIPAGCPEEDNDYTGGSAYLRGRDVDHETGVFTLVTSAKFGSNEELSFAFKDVMIFVVMNGWLCDPMGSEEDFEGSLCFDEKFNERDAIGQISLTD